MEEQIPSDLTNLQIFIRIFVILTVTFFLARALNYLYKRFLEKSQEKGTENLTTYKFLEHAISVVVYVIGFSFAISVVPFLRPVAASIVGAAGIMAIAVGFAAQQALGNIVSGVFIVMSKPYQINDRISMSDGVRGVVEDISLRHTVIRNFENQRIIIPNSIISNQVLTNSNYTDKKICRLIDIGISYESDIDLAKSIMAEEIGNHPLNMDNRKPEDIEKGTPKVMVRVLELGDSSVLLRAWVWAADTPDAFVMQCDVLESIKKRFDNEGIVIPFPQRTISYLNGSEKPLEESLITDK
ncbi:MAG: mechanosensitive ion channel family protein [Balneolaceae bacterium]|nr:mechanosensitive ion channel family protein [Balneolaceae bacterium]